MLNRRRARVNFCGSFLIANLVIAAPVIADEVICEPLPNESVRLEIFDNGDSNEFHMYFPTSYKDLVVRSATVDFKLAREGGCRSCESVELTMMYAGSRFTDNSVDTFSVAFELPKNVIGEVDVAARYSGYCAASMRVMLDTSKPEMWPAPLTNSDFRRVPRARNEDKSKSK